MVGKQRAKGFRKMERMVVKMRKKILNKSSTKAILILPLLSLFLILFVFPLGKLFWISLNNKGSFDAYRYILSEGFFRKIFLNTVSLSFETAAVSLIICLPLAYILVTARARLASLVLSLVMLPFWMSILVRSFAWTVLLQQHGVINDFLVKIGLARQDLLYNRFSVLIGMIYIFTPYVVLILYNSFRKVDQFLINTGFCLGANKFENLYKVFLPQVKSGIILAFLYVFIISFGYFITPALLGGAKETTISMFIDTDMNQTLNWTQGAALSFLIIAVIFPILAFGAIVMYKRNLNIA
jgi:ABC-type spermidine/putrescine transport system permease subunit I